MTRVAKATPTFSRRARVCLLVLAAVGFLLALYLQLPASLLQRFIPSPLPAPWSLSPGGMTTNGTLWHGELQGLQAGASPLVVRWELSPWRVLLGTLRGNATVETGKQQLSGDFQLDFQGHGDLSNLRGAVDLALLQPASARPWRGQVLVDLKALSIGPMGATGFAGDVKVLSLTSPALAQPLGDFRLEWPQGANQGRVSSLRGPVSLRAAVVPQAGNGFRLEGEATTGTDASPALLESLAFIGSPDASGRYRIAVEFGVSERP